MKKADIKYNQVQLFWSISVALLFAAVALQHTLNPGASSLSPSPVATQFSPPLPAPSLPDTRSLR